ncbi:MAG: hypothetical protein AAF621_06715, partial [Pseudomonadota bacterium]
AGHSGATIKKFVAVYCENWPCPQDTAKISHCCVKFLGNIPDIPREICLALKNFSTYALHSMNVHTP